MPSAPRHPDYLIGAAAFVDFFRFTDIVAIGAGQLYWTLVQLVFATSTSVKLQQAYV